jgi:hypothetical protein
MCEWRKAFYIRIGPVQQVLLTTDNFAPHITALGHAPPPPNIRIAWLPKKLDKPIPTSRSRHN